MRSPTVRSLLVIVPCLGSVATAQCVPAPQSGSPIPGILGTVAAATNWDPDGPGPGAELVAMIGTFTAAGAVYANNAAAYDPGSRTFVALGSAMPPTAACVATSPGGALFAGTTAGEVLAWTGTDWQVIGAAASGGVGALCMRSNGELVAGGSFQALGGTARLARWNGASWSSLGVVTKAGASAVVEALVELPSGELVAAGQFDAIAGVPMTGLGLWNGSTWSAPGVFTGGTPSLLAVDGSGGLVASGFFSTVNGTPVGVAARWDGASWSDFSTGLPTWPSFLTTSNGTLIAGLGVTIGVWGGTTWTPMPAPPSTDTRAAVRVAGGDLLSLGAPTASVGGNRWRLGAWQVLSSGTTGQVLAVTALPDSSWAVGGAFGQLGATLSAGIAQGGAAGFVDLATSQVNSVGRLARLSSGELVALASSGVWVWNGGIWAGLGGVTWPVGYGMHAMVATPGGGLLAGKSDLPLSVGAELWTWNGTSWLTESLPGSVPGQTRFLLQVGVLPNGDRVVAGNRILPPSIHIATFDGTNLTPLGVGPDQPVIAMLVRANGDIVVGGTFSNPFPGIARWDGNAWQPLGSGVQGVVQTIAELPNGDLLVGGAFATAGGVPAANLARWDGANWSAFGPSPTGLVNTIGVAPNGEVAVGGQFLQVGSTISCRITFYPPACPATASSYGTGCAAASGTVALTAESLPWLGSVYRATATGHPANSLVLGVRGLAPLALPLVSVLPQAGAGCQLLVSPDLLDLYVATSTSLDVGFAIPPSMALVGQSLRQQVVPLQLNGAGAIVALQSSNALTLTIGSL